jgi:hypothetical protein
LRFGHEEIEMPVLQVRMSDAEMDSLKAAAFAETVPLSAFVRGILFPAPGKPVSAEQVKDLVDSTLKDAVPMGLPNMPSLQKEPPVPSNFKRSPKCESAKCLRLQRPTCDACRQANAKSYS